MNDIAKMIAIAKRFGGGGGGSASAGGGGEKIIINCTVEWSSTAEGMATLDADFATINDLVENNQHVYIRIPLLNMGDDAYADMPYIATGGGGHIFGIYVLGESYSIMATPEFNMVSHFAPGEV